MISLCNLAEKLWEKGGNAGYPTMFSKACFVGFFKGQDCMAKI